jgi:hypothetical protein
MNIRVTILPLQDSTYVAIRRMSLADMILNIGGLLGHFSSVSILCLVEISYKGCLELEDKRKRRKVESVNAPKSHTTSVLSE